MARTRRRGVNLPDRHLFYEAEIGRERFDLVVR